VNVAGLLLARAEARSREVATRVALGGGRGALLRQLITESVVLSGIGGLLGIVLGVAGIRLLAVYAASELGIWQELALDWRVLGVSLLLAGLTGLLFGVAPAIQTVRVDIRKALAVGGGRGYAGGMNHWPRRLLVASEVALGLVLLIGAGLMIRTFWNLYNVPLGFDETNVITTSVSLNDARYSEAADVHLYIERTLERIRGVPGVESAAVGLHIPYERWLNLPIRVPGAPGEEEGRQITTLNYVTPGYLETLGIAVKRGRRFEEADNRGGAPVLIVNETFARRYFPNEDPLGRVVELPRGDNGQAFRVVGVVGDVQQVPGLSGGRHFLAEPAVYLPPKQLDGGTFRLIHTWFSPNWVIRGRVDPRGLAETIREEFATVDPLLPTTQFRRIEDYRGNRLSFERTQLVLLAIMASLALMLSAVGIYGLVSQVVAQRKREIGIRIVLGS
jgi:predicted permease